MQDKEILIFIDSCDHLIDAAAAWIELVISKTADVSILTTSREPLRVQGERVHRLGGLEVPRQQGGETAVEAMRYAGVQLFIERAKACLGGYLLTDEDAPYVDWPRTCDGSPQASDQ